MNIAIDHVDQAGNKRRRSEHLSYLAFLKHFAVAGQGYLPSVNRLLRVVGSFCWFFDYLNPRAFSAGRFGMPPSERYDPTAQSQFSNLTGKAIGDLLAKRIDRAQVTFGYEAAMALAGHPIKGARPDLLCVSRRKQFAVEAKGFDKARVSAAEMAEHKIQAASGPLPVHFHVASVAYDFYRSPNCKYHDPVNEDVRYAETLVTRLSQQYYSGWAEFLNSDLFIVSEANIFGRDFHVLRPNRELPVLPLWYVPWFGDPALLLDANTRQFADTGRLPEGNEVIDRPGVFIDADGVGLATGALDI